MARRTGWGVRAVTVPATTAPNKVTVITAPCRLCGWSLASADLAGTQGEGTQTSPAATTTIVTLGTVAAGEYTVNWQVELSGTLAAADANNFQLLVGGVVQVASANEATANVFPQVPVQINVPAGGAVVLIRNLALATVGAVYTAQLSLVSERSARGAIFDSSQQVGSTSMDGIGTDTQWLADDGVYITSNVTVQVNDGTISGVVYVTDYDAHEYREQWQAMRYMNST